MKDAVFIFSEEQLSYSFSDTHPFNQKRIVLTLDLLTKMDAITDEDIIKPTNGDRRGIITGP